EGVPETGLEAHPHAALSPTQNLRPLHLKSGVKPSQDWHPQVLARPETLRVTEFPGLPLQFLGARWAGCILYTYYPRPVNGYPYRLAFPGATICQIVIAAASGGGSLK